jgi:hypothetical protein
MQENPLASDPCGLGACLKKVSKTPPYRETVLNLLEEKEYHAE